MPNIGPKTAQKLLLRWPNLEVLFNLSTSELLAHGLSERLISAFKKIDHAGVDSDYTWCHQQKNRFILTWEDEDYPSVLKEIFDPLS